MHTKRTRWAYRPEERKQIVRTQSKWISRTLKDLFCNKFTLTGTKNNTGIIRRRCSVQNIQYIEEKIKVKLTTVKYIKCHGEIPNTAIEKGSRQRSFHNVSTLKTITQMPDII